MRTANLELGTDSPRKRPVSSTMRKGSPPSQGLESRRKTTRAESLGAVTSRSMALRMRGDGREAQAVIVAARSTHEAKATRAGDRRSMSPRLLRQLVQPRHKGVATHQGREGRAHEAAPVQRHRLAE